jgi:Asp-tRNA(Asn)/Glu-tRNA(Gln) amidotransferase C subunit
MNSSPSSALYRKLLPLVNRFVMLRQGGLGQMYVGRLLNVDTESVELQTYQADGTESAQWTINLNTITEFVSKSNQLDMLALKVKWALSPEKTEEATEDLNALNSSDKQQQETIADSI